MQKRTFVRHFLCVALLTVLAASAIANTARADGGPADGAISPVEKARANAKDQLMQQAIDAAAKRNDPVYDYAQIAMSLWAEPQTTEAILWCGPGSTQAVVGQWRGNAYVDNYSGAEGTGADAYMKHLAITLGEFDGTRTTYENYVRVTNLETASAFYVQEVVGSFNRYQEMLTYDIQTHLHPLAPVVNANGLPGWNYNVAHFLTVKQYWISGNTTTYGDTAGAIQSRSMSANWNVVPLADFYLNHIAPIGQYSWDEVVW